MTNHIHLRAILALTMLLAVMTSAASGSLVVQRKLANGTFETLTQSAPPDKTLRCIDHVCAPCCGDAPRN
jgi:formate-dependent phosphoribosylglycinamide formyltransferase (GAR transformylase)